MIAALFVETDGVYSGRPEVEAWPVERDARRYAGPHSVVAHPPCARWGKFWSGGPLAAERFRLGDDDGCFAAALFAVRTFGGVIEHPACSQAWPWFGLRQPPRDGGWIVADSLGGWTCCVDQGRYGHFAAKQTWLYAIGIEPPDLRWGRCEQRLHPRAVELHGERKAMRIGMMAMVGGNADTKQRIRSATPPEFCELLIAMAQTASGGTARKLGGDGIRDQSLWLPGFEMAGSL